MAAGRRWWMPRPPPLLRLARDRIERARPRRRSMIGAQSSCCCCCSAWWSLEEQQPRTARSPPSASESDTVPHCLLPPVPWYWSCCCCRRIAGETIPERTPQSGSTVCADAGRRPHHCSSYSTFGTTTIIAVVGRRRQYQQPSHFLPQTLAVRTLQQKADRDGPREKGVPLLVLRRLHETVAELAQQVQAVRRGE